MSRCLYLFFHEDIIPERSAHMSNSNAQNQNNLYDIVAESGAKKVSESIANSALKTVTDFAKDRYGKAQVLLGTVFTRYLSNATERYNKIRTLATGIQPRKIIGADSLYVHIGVRYKEKEINIETVDGLLNISKNILISGTGGAGKSMLMRYLFLNTANRGEYVPILLELRRINKQSSEEVSILELVYTCMQDFDVQLPKEQFEFSLRSGKYLFLLDGLDEVKEKMANKTVEAIQKFVSKYPKNPCIVTSRPRQNVVGLETFVTVESMQLSKDKAVLLASKMWEEDEKTREFCRQLKEKLYDAHRDFAENPLLLSMMFLTFMRNGSIPEHLEDFYQKAYDALYSVHDTNDKIFTREFKCVGLDENKFKLLFAYFCFHSYFKEIYEFSEKDVLELLEKGVQKMGLGDVNSKKYLEDLEEAVCMLIKEGEIYRFAHRSFQAYFAAYYTSRVLTDEQQKKLFIKNLSEERCIKKEDYYTLLNQIEPERFAANALEEGLRNVLNVADSDARFFKLIYDSIGVRLCNGSVIKVVFDFSSDVRYYHNLVRCFCDYFSPKKFTLWGNKWRWFKSIGKIIEKYVINIYGYSGGLDYVFYTPIEELEKTYFEEEEKAEFYHHATKFCNIHDVRGEIRQWLSELDQKRKFLEKQDFIDDL